jgi:hypothetical protein
LRTGDRGRADNLQAGDAQRGGGGRDSVPGRHEVIDNHHAGRAVRPARCHELPLGGQPPLGSGQLGRVGSVGGQGDEASDADRHAAPAQDASRVDRQPLDVLATAASRGHGRGRDRDEPNRARAEAELGNRRGQRQGQPSDEIAASALLVGKQARSRRPGVDGGDGDQREPRRRRIRPVRPGSGQRQLTAPADRPTDGGAAGAPARQGQIGQDGEHATTVPPPLGTRKTEFAICG